VEGAPDPFMEGIGGDEGGGGSPVAGDAGIVDATVWVPWFKRNWAEESPDSSAYAIIGEREKTARKAMEKHDRFLDMVPPTRWKRFFKRFYDD